MSYSVEIYEKAIKSLEKIRIINQKNCEKKKALFFAHSKRAAEIEKLLSQTSIKAAKSVLSGKNCAEQLKILKEKNLALQNELHELLKNCNLPLDYLDVRYNCQKCNDTGFVDGRMCQCLKQILKNEAYRELNELSPLELSSFETFSLDYYSSETSENVPSAKTKMEKIFHFCRHYAQNFSKTSESLFMTGKTGLGKTHLSLAIANDVINKNFGVIYISTPNIVSKLEREKFKRDGTYENTEVHILGCDLLILDDLGTEFQTAFSNSTIYNIINSRILCKKPTIISTNYTIQEIQKNYSERLVSRIWGHFKLLGFVGSDVRSQIATEKATLAKKEISNKT